MNKDVIYIEPEDDITDIISKLKASEQRVIALVPPKNIGVLRSAVNTKLISKTAKLNDKVAVIVTKDPSLIKLSTVAGLPVADTLQSRPKMPEDFSPDELSGGTTPISIDERNLDDPDGSDDSDGDDESANAKSSSKKPNASNKANNRSPKKADQELKSSDLEEESPKSEKKEKKGKNGSKIPSLDKYRKWIILGIIAFILLVGFIVWAVIFAPAASIIVNVRTTANNFSEEVSFTTEESKEDAKKGIFYLESEEYKKDDSVEFSATGSKDVGEKARGTLQVSVYVQGGTYNIPAGAEFRTGDLAYTANTGATLTKPSKEKTASCENDDPVGEGACLLTASVDVTATASGDKYNVPTGRSWSSSLSGKIGRITNAGSFSGGTSKTQIFVQQSDVENAKTRLGTSDEEDGKKELEKKFGDDMIVIEDSYQVEPTNVVSNPAVGAEIADNTSAKLTATTVYKMSAVKKSSVEKFIKKIAKKDLGEDQKVYSVGDPFFEKFTTDKKATTARLKTTTQTGPKITENDVLEKAKGKKTGEVQTLIKSINGVSSVKVNTSFFWVNSIPDDPNKIQIELKVEE